jgi:hypothetical protein
MLVRFFGLSVPSVAVPVELEGGPTEFGDSGGRPYLLELRFGYVPSDTDVLAHATWRLRCV